MGLMQSSDGFRNASHTHLKGQVCSETEGAWAAINGLRCSREQPCLPPPPGLSSPASPPGKTLPTCSHTVFGEKQGRILLAGACRRSSPSEVSGLEDQISETVEKGISRDCTPSEKCHIPTAGFQVRIKFPEVTVQVPVAG